MKTVAFVRMDRGGDGGVVADVVADVEIRFIFKRKRGSWSGGGHGDVFGAGRVDRLRWIGGGHAGGGFGWRGSIGSRLGAQRVNQPRENRSGRAIGNRKMTGATKPQGAEGPSGTLST